MSRSRCNAPRNAVSISRLPVLLFDSCTFGDSCVGQICTECGLLLFSVDQMNYNIIAAAIVLCVKTIYSSIYYNYFPTVFIIIIIFITYMKQYNIICI